jgi:cytochrome c553
MRLVGGKVLAATAMLVMGGTYAMIVMAAQAGIGKVETFVVETCAGCHAEDGNSVVPGFPKLAGQQQVYLLREMMDYKEGRRQSDIMAPVLADLSAEDVTKLAAYFAAQKPTPDEVANPERLALGKRVYLEGNTQTGVPSCDGCHEENGEGSKKFPRVAGQHAEYVLEQLAQYASGQRSNGKKVMRTIAERLSKEEAEAVAEYMSSLK